MSFIGVIVLVVVLVLYVARSVEKQNAEAVRRREQMRGKRPVSVGKKNIRQAKPAADRPLDNRPVPDEQEEQTAGGNTMMQSYQRAIKQSRRTSPPQAGRSTVPLSRPVLSHPDRDHHPQWLQDRQAVQRAFIFSECIGRPRSLNPHPWFRNKK